MPSTSSHSRFLRPALSWLITADPTTPFSVRNMINAVSSVVTSISGASSSSGLRAALKLADVAAGRCGMEIAVVATSSAIRSPVTHSARSHQWDPMSPKARDGPPSSGSTRHEVAIGSSSQSCR